MKMSTKALVATLLERDGWTDAQTLADTYQVTTRTVRTYVRKANEELGTEAVESSRQGYRVADREAAERFVGTMAGADARTRRQDRLMRILVSGRPESIYDIADRLHVSDSTLQVMLRDARTSAAEFGLEIGRNRDMVWLEGAERDKRRLITHMLSTRNSMNFVALAETTVGELGYDLQELRDMVTVALDANRLSYNDYGLNNLVMHLSVMLSRVEDCLDMPDDVAAEVMRPSPELDAARNICDKVLERLSLDIGLADVHYLSLSIEANTKRQAVAAIVSPEESELDERDLRIAQDAAAQVARIYCLEEFSDEFVHQLATHIHALLGRASIDAFIYNPLAKQVRDDYPLVHDMAVVLADVVSREGGIQLNEDEIAFFTFHLGGYFQNNSFGHDRVTCAVLYINYNQLQESLLQRLERAFGDQIEIVAVESVAAYTPGSLTCDIIVSQLPVEVPAGCQRVVVGPLFGSADEARVRKAIEAVLLARRGEAVERALATYLRRDLFRLEWYPGNREETIANIVSDCMDKGLVGEGYFGEVMQREEMSPTAFNNLVAIPHALAPSAKESFLYLVINQRPIAWGEQSANIILLLGISDENRQSFTDLYSDFIAVLCDPSNAAELMRATSYDDAMERMRDMISRQRLL